jgi:hypothetical protein
MRIFLLTFTLIFLAMGVAKSANRDLSEFDVYQKIDSKMIDGVKTPMLFYGNIKNIGGSGCYFTYPNHREVNVLFEADPEMGWPGCFAIKNIDVIKVNRKIFYVASYLLEEPRNEFTKYHALFELGDKPRYCENSNLDDALEKISKKKRYEMVSIWKAQEQVYKRRVYEKAIKQVGCH